MMHCRRTCRRLIDMAPAVRVSFAVMICMMTVAGSKPEGWTVVSEILASPGFGKYLLGVSRLARLDILMPRGYGPDQVRSLALLLKHIPLPVAFFTGSYPLESYKHVSRVGSDRHALLWFFDGNPEDIIRVKALSLHYYVQIAVLAYNIKTQNTTQGNSDMAYLKDAMQFANVLIAAIDQQIMAAGRNEFTCVNCTSGSTNELEVTLRNNELALEGSRFRVYCRNLYTCESSRLEILRQLLVHRNVSFFVKSVKTIQNYVEVASSTNKDLGTLIHFPISFPVSQSFFPALSVPFYDDVGMETFFEEAQKSMTREAVLLLPFSPRVWLALLIVFVVCLFVGFLICWIRLARLPELYSLAAPFAASVLQQSSFVDKDALRYQSFRILLGVWMLMATILATGYKGVVTTLLGNVPLLGELGTFLHEDGLARVNLCRLDFIFDHHGYEKKIGFYGDPYTNKTCQSASRSKKKRRGEREVYVTMVRGSKPMEDLIDKVLARGYVQLRETGSPFFSGPEMRSVSPYLKPVGRLLSRSFEAGLLQRVTSVDSFKRSWKLQVRHQVGGDPIQAMKVTDLRPAFVVWAAGIGFSCFVFFVPYFVFAIHRFGDYIKAKYFCKK